MVLEQAKKELEKLEKQYPDGFQSLKLDLKSFISQLEEEQEQNLSSQQYYSTASTHVSSTKKRKKDKSDVEEMRDDDEAESKMVYMRRSCCYYGKRRDMITDAAIERAQVCLQKVQQFKTTFFHY